MVFSDRQSAVRRAPPAASPQPVPSARCRRAQSSGGHPGNIAPPRLCNHLPRPLLLLRTRTEAGKGWQPKSLVEGDFLGAHHPIPPSARKAHGLTLSVSSLQQGLRRGQYLSAETCWKVKSWDTSLASKKATVPSWQPRKTPSFRGARRTQGVAVAPYPVLFLRLRVQKPFWDSFTFTTRPTVSAATPRSHLGLPPTHTSL